MSPIRVIVLGALATLLAARPDVVIVMVDDMGYSDIGCQGGEIPTPNIDRLAGYRGFLSRWRLGYHQRDRWPLQRGFEKYYGIIAGASSYLNPQPPRGLTLQNQPVEPEGDNYYTTEAFTDFAIRFVDEQPDDRPFFLYLAYTAPHWPLHAKQ